MIFISYSIIFLGCNRSPDPGTIKGEVIDENGNPAKLITIRSEETSFNTSTNEEGKYELRGLSPGKIRIIAYDRLKYKDEIIDTFLAIEEGLVLDFQMKHSNFSLQEWGHLTRGKIYIDAIWTTIEDSLEYDTYMTKYEITNQLYLDFLNSAKGLGYIKVKDEYQINYDLWGRKQRTKTNFLSVYDSHGDLLIRLGRTNKQIQNYPSLEKSVRSAASDIYYENSSFHIYDGFENHPVRCLSFNGAKYFAEFYSCRIPTYKEWWRGAFGDSKNYWDDKFSGKYINFASSDDPYENGIYQTSTPVGFYNGSVHDKFETKDAKSPFGLYDMIGNVREYIYDAQDKPNAAGYSYEDFVGSLSMPTAAQLLSKAVEPDGFYNICGFRVVTDRMNKK